MVTGVAAAATRRPRKRHPSWFESRMLALADRLFTEYDSVPVMTVIRAIVAAHARAEVAMPGERPAPETIYALAREQLADPDWTGRR